MEFKVGNRVKCIDPNLSVYGSIGEIKSILKSKEGTDLNVTCDGFCISAPVEKFEIYDNTFNGLSADQQLVALMQTMQRCQEVWNELVEKGILDPMSNKIGDIDWYRESEIKIDWCREYETLYYDTPAYTEDYTNSTEGFFTRKILDRFSEQSIIPAAELTCEKCRNLCDNKCKLHTSFEDVHSEQKACDDVIPTGLGIAEKCNINVEKEDFYYGMRIRPCDIGSYPKEGFLGKLEEYTGRYHDIIYYDRVLTEEEESHYSLTRLMIDDGEILEDKTIKGVTEKLVEVTTNNIFFELQKYLAITSGDIEPMLSIKLDKAKGLLTDVIVDVINRQRF